METTETTGRGDHMGTFWGLWEQCEDDGDDGDDTGKMWTTGTMGQHGVETTETTEETTAMGTTWGPSGGYGDDVGTTGMTQG